MKYSCGLIRDLLPLYHDNVCSADSLAAVEEHLQECEECRIYDQRIKAAEDMDNVIYNPELEQQKAESIKRVKSKMNKKIVLIIVGVVLLCIAIDAFILFGAIGLLMIDYCTSEVEVNTDITRYEEYIGGNAREEYRNKWGMDETIFPENITDRMDVQDYKMVYYNPFDAQYLSYLTVEYSEEDYDAEAARLNEKGIDDYEGYYSVTGAPEGYRILAMDADSYQGFVYAMTSEEDNCTISYVEVIFCNYFLDLDIHDYVPDKYILQGFDASEGNEYLRLQKSYTD